MDDDTPGLGEDWSDTFFMQKFLIFPDLDLLLVFDYFLRSNFCKIYFISLSLYSVAVLLSACSQKVGDHVLLACLLVSRSYFETLLIITLFVS